MALTLRRGFRRLSLILSIAWIGGSGVFLWRVPPTPEPIDYDGLARQCGEAAKASQASARGGASPSPPIAAETSQSPDYEALARQLGGVPAETLAQMIRR